VILLNAGDGKLGHVILMQQQTSKLI